jgi:hypothetical protein
MFSWKNNGGALKAAKISTVIERQRRVERLRIMTIFGNIIRAKRLIRHLSKRQVLGWLAVALSTSIACFWAFWGIIENFTKVGFTRLCP